MSFDVFLLEKGTKLTLIFQSYKLIQHQPTVTLTRHDTNLYISKTVYQVLDDTCQDILAYERIDCIINEVQEKNLSTSDFCLPFQFHNVFPKLRLSFPSCMDNLTLSTNNINVNSFHFTTFIICIIFNYNVKNI